MRKLAFVLVLGLAACAGNKEPPTAMDISGQMDKTLATADGAILGYLAWPDCDAPHVGLCSADSIVVQIKPIKDTAYKAVKAYEKAALDPTTGNDALEAAKVAAIDALADLITLTSSFAKE